MPVSNGRFSKPIRLKEDLANFFGLSANLGNIIVNGSINKWSKHKPVRYPDFPPRDLAWWKGIDGDCGLDVKINDYLNAYKNGNAYEYKKPRGNSYKEPYRALDFDGYNHNAQPFIKTHISNGFLENINYAYTKYYRFSIEYIETSETDLVFSDLDLVFYNGVENVYLAYDVYSKNPLTNNSAQLKRTVVSDYNITSASGKQIEITFDDSDVGQTIYVLLYLKDTQLPMTAPIPYDDDNYMLLSFKVTELVGLSGNMINIAGIGDLSWTSLTGSVSPTNAFSTNYGQKEIQIQTTLTNNNTVADNISNYDFRLRVTGTNISNQSVTEIFTPTFLSNMNGVPIYSLSIGASSTVTTVLSCGKIFEDFINSSANKFITMYLDAKLKSSNDWYSIANRGLFIKE